MKKNLYLLLPLFIVLMNCTRSQTAPPASPVKLDKGAAEKVIKEIENDRADTQEWLRSSAYSYLAAVDRVNFDDRKTLTVGRANDKAARKPESALLPAQGRQSERLPSQAVHDGP
jgi:hypothetical protein